MAEESKLEKKLRECVKALGGKARKWECPGETGVPDRIVTMPHNRTYFVETKAPKGSLSPRQEYVKKEMSKTGHRVYVIHTETQLSDFLKLITAVHEIDV